MTKRGTCVHHGWKNRGRPTTAAHGGPGRPRAAQGRPRAAQGGPGAAQSGPGRPWAAVKQSIYLVALCAHSHSSCCCLVSGCAFCLKEAAYLQLSFAAVSYMLFPLCRNPYKHVTKQRQVSSFTNLRSRQELLGYSWYKRTSLMSDSALDGEPRKM